MFLSKDNKIKWRLLGFSAIVVIVLCALGIAWFDKPLYVLLRNLDCGLFKFFEYVFDAWVWLAGFGIVTLYIYIKKIIKSPNSFKNNVKKLDLISIVKDAYAKVKNNYAFWMFCSVLCASVIGKILKICIGRFRPVFFEALGITGFKPFATDWAFNSMPSGHTFATFAALVMVGMLKPKYKPLTWSFAILIGVSRVAVGAHWPTDVLLGAFIGMVVADFVLAHFRK